MYLQQQKNHKYTHSYVIMGDFKQKDSLVLGF